MQAAGQIACLPVRGQGARGVAALVANLAEAQQEVQAGRWIGVGGGVERRQGPLVQPARLVEGHAGGGVGGGGQGVAHRLRRRGTAGRSEVRRQFRRMHAHPLVPQSLQGAADREVEAMTCIRREPGHDGLAEQVVAEAIGSIARLDQHPRPDRLVEQARQVGGAGDHAPQQRQRHLGADDGGNGQQVDAGL